MRSEASWLDAIRLTADEFWTGAGCRFRADRRLLRMARGSSLGGDARRAAIARMDDGAGHRGYDLLLSGNVAVHLITPVARTTPSRSPPRQNCRRPMAARVRDLRRFEQGGRDQDLLRWRSRGRPRSSKTGFPTRSELRFRFTWGVAMTSRHTAAKSTMCGSTTACSRPTR